MNTEEEKKTEAMPAPSFTVPAPSSAEEQAEARLEEEEWDQWKLIEKAALGDIEAAAKLGEGYLEGFFDGKVLYEKSRKWSSYAAKHGSLRAAAVLKKLDELGK